VIDDENVETDDELIEDGISDSSPELLSDEDYQMFLDCQGAMKNDKGKSPLDAPPSTYSIGSHRQSWMMDVILRIAQNNQFILGLRHHSW
jgi:hypothetical protein